MIKLLGHSASVAQPLCLHHFSVFCNEFNKGQEIFKSLSRMCAKDKGGTSPKYPRREPKTFSFTRFGEASQSVESWNFQPLPCRMLRKDKGEKYVIKRRRRRHRGKKHCLLWIRYEVLKLIQTVMNINNHCKLSSVLHFKKEFSF